ncbi:FAD-dependent oxidoreductase [Tsukamurella sp. 8F]|uniref:flavin monoamine oxidase family protein n=1 Tax=unclassified Tsukamurella TaxID=2633480 RepID=UPI0023B8AF38|nr:MULTISPECIES: NAD(P)/FAD-dependent oxidoreductase [unclassified Tsukamurella]MDF0528789.1 FAD-dependent oxidoreductase [Tsukamurella sp. 8J]MDF0586624.1 FAD-dependent oxidoreductase [Tsukamurella sp. 8F]
MTQPVNHHHADGADEPPLTMFGPDFPFAYDDWVASPEGLGSIPESARGTEVAIIGAGLSGLVAARHLARLGLEPVVYEAERIGGRMRSERFDGYDDDIVAEMGAMRFPPSSTTLYHYLNELGLDTAPFPNPLSEATPSTVVDLKGQAHFARTVNDLPQVYRDVAAAWDATLADHADAAELTDAIRRRDAARLRNVWGRLVERLDDQTFYGFLTDSDHFRSFRHREVFGQVGFGTGGWDTDYPNSMLEILRVTCTAADDHHRGIVGGSDQLPMRLWDTPFGEDGVSVKDLNGGAPRPAVTAIRRTSRAGGYRYTITDAAGEIRSYDAALFTGQAWMLLNTIDCDDDLLPIDHWTAVERTHYMGSSKVFALVDRPFWKDVDPTTGREAMSMTLTDRMSRGTYLLDHGDDRPGVVCLSYTWSDDSLKLLPLDANARMDLMLKSLGEIYPDVDIRSHIIATPKTVSWETERYFMGAFKANLPGHYRYQERLYTHFMQDRLDERHRGFFLAGDDVSWTAGWAEGAIQTALNAVWGIVHHLGGATAPGNPGPGDVFEQIAPIRLGDERGTRI